jgi:epimerase transport system membrane fusion protein
MSSAIAKQVPPQSDRGFQLIGFILFLVVFVGFGGWSVLAPLGSAAPAPGMLVVESQRQVIQHLEGGILETLLVRQGDRVDTGQVLAKLDVTQVRANLDVAESQLKSTEAQVARLQTERAGLDAIDWPPELLSSPNPRVIDLMDEQRFLFERRKRSLEGELSILERRIAQLISRIDGLKNTKATREELLQSFQDEYTTLSKLLAEGFVDEMRVRDLERRIVEVRGEIQTIQSDMKSAEIQVGETELQIIQRRSVFDAEVQGQLAELQARRVELEEQVRVAEDRLQRSEIKAPAEGVVLTIEVTTEGGVIPAGQPFMTLVPNEDELIIEAQVNPVDVDRVGLGQTAEVQFSSFDANAIPKIFAEVVSVSADALADPNTGASYYLAKLNIPDDELPKLSGYDLVPGMPVNVLIQTGERTLWQYLTKPLAQGMSKALIED